VARYMKYTLRKKGSLGFYTEYGVLFGVAVVMNNLVKVNV